MGNPMSVEILNRNRKFEVSGIYKGTTSPSLENAMGHFRYGGKVRVNVNHPLDNPIWNALTTRHAHLAEGSGTVRRYPGEIAPFAAIPERNEVVQAECARYFTSGQTAGFLAVAPDLRDEWVVQRQFDVFQMIFPDPLMGVPPDEEIVLLGDGDVEAMLELKDLVYPAYFRRGTIALGDYFGIWRDGRLAAMAGIRMAMPGFQELSAVCVHTDWRGHGLAQRLCRHVVAYIQRQGDTPFLHTETDNVAAHSLYEKLGFTDRRVLTFRILLRS